MLERVCQFVEAWIMRRSFWQAQALLMLVVTESLLSAFVRVPVTSPWWCPALLLGLCNGLVIVTLIRRLTRAEERT